MQKKHYRIIAYIVPLVLIIDQLIKILVKTNMQIGEEIPLIGDWCKIYFVENEGMAFGVSFGGYWGKLCLSLFRIIASSFIMWYLLSLVKKGTRTAIVVSMSLIFVGAVGNLIDSCFYGLIFDNSYYNVAQLFPPEGGYAPLFFGKVVDMFYLPLIDTVWPEWVPVVGGQPFVFFNAIFNFADIAITFGVIILIVDQLFFAKRGSKSADNEKE